jgi:hypothetical protein
MSDRTTDRDRQATDRTVLSVPHAAAQLGITPDAVRSRLHRGTLAGEKRSGVWRVFFSPTGMQQDATGTQRASDRHTPDAVIVRLESEVTFLRNELESRTEETRRLHHLLAGALERIPELPAGDMPQERNPAPSRDDTATTAHAPVHVDARPWWRRLLGR